MFHCGTIRPRCLESSLTILHHIERALMANQQVRATGACQTVKQINVNSTMREGGEATHVDLSHTMCS